MQMIRPPPAVVGWWYKADTARAGNGGLGAFISCLRDILTRNHFVVGGIIGHFWIHVEVPKSLLHTNSYFCLVKFHRRWYAI
jgi:hypothetical protein